MPPDRVRAFPAPAIGAGIERLAGYIPPPPLPAAIAPAVLGHVLILVLRRRGPIWGSGLAGDPLGAPGEHQHNEDRGKRRAPVPHFLRAAGHRCADPVPFDRARCGRPQTRSGVARMLGGSAADPAVTDFGREGAIRQAAAKGRLGTVTNGPPACARVPFSGDFRARRFGAKCRPSEREVTEICQRYG